MVPLNRRLRASLLQKTPAGGQHLKVPSSSRRRDHRWQIFFPLLSDNIGHACNNADTSSPPRQQLATFGNPSFTKTSPEMSFWILPQPKFPSYPTKPVIDRRVDAATNCKCLSAPPIGIITSSSVVNPARPLVSAGMARFQHQSSTLCDVKLGRRCVCA